MSATRELSVVGERPLEELLGARLSAMAEELVLQYSSDVCARAGGSAGSALSGQAPLQNITLMIGCIGRYVRNPGFDIRAQMLSHAPKEDFCPAREGADDLMSWLDGLSRLVIQLLRQEVAKCGKCFDSDSLIGVFERLHEGLQTMTSIAVSLRLERDAHLHGELVRRFADFNLMLRHELRSPVNSILLSTEILESPSCGSGVRQKQLKAIRSALAHAEGLLLDAERLTTALSGDPPARTMPLQAVFESMSAELVRRASSAGVALQFQASPPAVAVEMVVVQVVLSNLVINAIKYADDRKRNRWVKICAETVEDDAAALVVEVTDNGLGIPAHLQHRVFGRHFRAHPQVAEGTGLGLAICREILAARGGAIGLASEEGIGTTVRVVLRTGPVPGVFASRRNQSPSYCR